MEKTTGGSLSKAARAVDSTDLWRQVGNAKWQQKDKKMIERWKKEGPKEGRKER